MNHGNTAAQTTTRGHAHRCYVTLLPRLLLYLAPCVLFLVFCAVSTATAGEYPDYAPGVVIVKFSSDDRAEIDAFLNRSGAYSTERAFPVAQSSQQLSAVYRLEFSPGADVGSIARQYERDPTVEYAQPNYLNHLCSTTAGKPNDFFYEHQWALQAIDAPKAWKIEKGSRDVVIAIVDTGVDYNHEDLRSRIWINPGEIDDNGLDDDGNGYADDIRGWDFADSPGLPSDMDYLDRDNDPMDEDGHGTHVSGVAAAVPDNSEGIAGVTWNCRIMALRGGAKFLEDDDVSAAIVYAADNGAHIINMSWGGEHLSYIIRDVIEYAYSRGCVLVAAVGNDDRPAVIYPALHKHVIAVGATDRWDKKAEFSNYGPGVDVVAPGHKVFGTTPNDKYSDWSGTSMATPVVCGVAALMLSKRPGLTSEEVAQILRSSADGIDDPLFADVGRVNAVKALTASSSLIAHITSPDNGAGADTALTISGTAAGFHFRGFQLEYRHVSDIDFHTDMQQHAPIFRDMDWKPIGRFQSAARIDDLLGNWDVARLDEGTYLVRLRVLGHDDLEAEDRVILNIDHSPPEITELRAVPRLDGDRYRYAVTWRTDDPTSGELYYRAIASESGFEKLIYSSVTNGHAIYASDEIAPGSYEYFVTATNTAGLVTVDDNNGDYYLLEIKALWITSDGFLETAVDIPATHPVSGTADFDGDGWTEIVGMESTKWQYDTVKIYERDESGGYEEVFASDADYFPWDVGDTDGDGLFEILGSKKDVTALYESPSAGSYPTEKIWRVEGIWGGQIADMDLDGKKEIISRHLDTSEIYIYENRGDNSYLRVARLPNPTEGDNYLAATSAISDFDGDGRIEIAIGDEDGDLFIYENTVDDRYSHIWTGGVPHSRIRSVTAGDLDGDGKDEFVVGSLSAGPSSAARQRWIYAIFSCSGQDEYEAVWREEIMGVKSKSAVSAADVDNDGRDEVIILVTPHLYIFKVTSRKSPGVGTLTTSDWQLNPIWNHSASNTRWLITEDLDADGANDILLNDEDKLTTFRWSPAADMLIRRPWGLSATPLDEDEVELRWNGPSDARSYKIYRGMDKEHLHLVVSLDVPMSSGSAGILPASSTTQGKAGRAVSSPEREWQVTREPNRPDVGYFRDAGLKSGVTYWYSVASADSVEKESDLAHKASATPNLPPRLLSAEYAPPSTVRLTFNEPMGPSAQNEAHYIIVPESRTPSSAVLGSQGKRVMATIDDLPQGTYTITVSGVRDTSGVPISANNDSAMFHVPALNVHDWTDLSRMVVYPNPVMPNSRHPGRIVFDSLPSATTVCIYNYNGQLVRRLDKAESGRSRKFWYLDNEEHQDVASGIYIYIVQCAGDRRVGKLAVVR